MDNSIEQFSQELATTYHIQFQDMTLLTEALTQRNYLNEHADETGRDYQRLEFLGDSVMQQNVAEYLYLRYPNWHEGQLTELRIAMVQSKSFAHFSRLVHLDTAVRLGKGEEMSGARNRDSLLEDIWEAFIGALYLDQGDLAVKSFLSQTVFAALDTDFFEQFIDYKSKLQETLQKSGAVKIVYETINEVLLDDNTQRFDVQVSVNDKVLASGTGSSIKDAEKMAANIALKQLQL